MRRRGSVLLVVTLVLVGALWVAPTPALRYVLSFPLLWVLPGLSWAVLIPPRTFDWVERLVVSLGLSYVVTPLVNLLVTYLPGPVTRPAVLVATVGSIGLPLALSALLVRGPGEPAVDAPGGAVARNRPSLLSTRHPFWRDGWAWLLVAMLIAVGLRTINLGYAEFEGDGAKILLRSAQAMVGDEAILFQHKKGPAQLTMVMPGWRLVGMTNEGMGRLPFSLVGALGVVAVFLCGRRLGYPHAGGIAACLLAIEGYHVGFGRGLKYHNLVLALGALGLLCFLVYHARGRISALAVGAALFAGGILAHYDAALALPAGGLLVLARLWADRGQPGRVAVALLVAIGIGAALLGMFYLPFLFGPHVEYTSSYVSSRVGGEVYNNLDASFKLSAVYNSIYLLLVLGVTLAGRTWVAWSRWGRAGLALAVVLLLAALTGWAWPERWVIEGATRAWVPFAVLLLGAILAPGQSVGVRSAWLWLTAPMLFYLFFVAVPLTHVYTIFPPAALLTGLGIWELGEGLKGRSRRALAVFGVVGAAVYVLCAGYAVKLFIDHSPEYLRTFPQTQAAVYWTPYEQLPSQVGLYGFPYRVGWKVVGSLMEQGELEGSYDSNEKPRATAYYTRQAVRLDCASPDMYITAVNVHDAVDIPWDQIEAEYRPAVVVTVDGQPKLTVHRRDVDGPPRTYRLEEYEALFDANTTPERVAQRTYPEIGVAQREVYTTREAVIGGFARLEGYKLDTERAVPGGYLELTLLWRALGPAPIDYQVFTHLYDGQMMRGQLDGQPVCDNLPTSEWPSDQLIADPYRIPIRADAPTGPVPLTVGMYDLATMQRLPVTAPDGTPVGDSVYLTDVTIQALH